MISSSGFCTNGRVVRYLQKLLRSTDNIICFSGYVGDNSSYLSWKIKNGKEKDVIKINHEEVKNKARCVELKTFSSHAQYNDLLEFGASLHCGRIVLVHGSEESKFILAGGLLERLSENNKTTKVLGVKKGKEICL